MSVARLYETFEIGNLLGSPEHRREFQTKGIRSSRFPWTPSINTEKEVGGNSKEIGGKKSYVETLLVTKFLRAASSPLAQARPTLPLPEEGGGVDAAGVDAGCGEEVGLGAAWSCLTGVWVAGGLAEEELGRGLQRLVSARFLRAMAW